MTEAKPRPARILSAALVMGGALLGGAVTKAYDTVTTPTASVQERADLNSLRQTRAVLRDEMAANPLPSAVVVPLLNTAMRSTGIGLSEPVSTTMTPRQVAGAIDRSMGAIITEVRDGLAHSSQPGTYEYLFDPTARAFSNFQQLLARNIATQAMNITPRRG